MQRIKIHGIYDLYYQNKTFHLAPYPYMQVSFQLALVSFRHLCFIGCV